MQDIPHNFSRRAFVFFCICLFYVIQVLYSDGGLVSSLVVPDGVSWFEYARGIEVANVYSEFFKSAVLRSSLVVYVIYIVPILISPFLIFFINYFIYSYSIKRFSLKNKIPYSPYYLFVVPYFIIALALPSKDLIVLLLVQLFLVSLFLKKNYAISFLYIVLCYFTRDGFAAVLLVFYVSYIFVVKMRLKTYFILLFVFGAVAVYILFGNYLLEGVFFYERNYSIALSKSVFLVTSENNFFSYLIRLFANATNLAFRPNFVLSEGGFDLLAFSYWVSGVSLLVAIILSLYSIVCDVKGKYINLYSVFIVASLLLVSLNPFIQPRYMFATMVAWIPVMGYYRRIIGMVYILIFLFSIMMSSLYYMVDMQKSPAVPFNFDFNFCLDNSI